MFPRRESIGLKKGLGISAVIVLGVFAIFVLAILFVNQGCSKLEIGAFSVSGKFEHCAMAAGQATQSAVLNAGISEDVASAAANTATAAAA